MPRTARGLNHVVTDLRPPWTRKAGEGQPVIFHHGVGVNLDIFAEWVPIISARHPVVRLDVRGFGGSVVPPESHVWSVTELIADVLEVVETAFGTARVHIMGESLGGTVALAAGLEHPHRFLSIAMSNAAIKGGQIGYAPGWREEIARIGLKGWSDKLMQMRFVPEAVTPQALTWFSAEQEKSPPHVVIALGELLVRTDLSEKLSALRLPLLYMMPDRSPFVSLAQASVLTALVPHAEVAVFPGARHGLPFSHARECARTLLAFLARVESGRAPPQRQIER
jgi:3-oxoadipate enol-lactonase